MKYSIIVPVYNAEQYIVRCLESLIGQTYDDFEIIVIDDGSIDASPKIVERYAKSQRRISFYRQKNGGCVAARCYGVKKASGSYCLFVDADDWLDDNALEIIDSYLKGEKDVDVLKFRFVYEPSGKYEVRKEITDRVLTEKELFDLRRKLLLTSEYNNLCNQVLKRSLYDKVIIKQDEMVCYGEDVMINLDILGRARRVMLVDETIYHYYENPNSVTHTVVIDDISNNISDNIQVNKKRIEYKRIFGIEDINDDKIKSMSILFMCNQIKKYLLSDEKVDFGELGISLIGSGIYDFVKDSRAIKVRGIDYVIYKSVMNRRYGFLRILKLFAGIKKRVKKAQK